MVRRSFRAHVTRSFSDGTPTLLVRDGSVESHDEPPSEDFDQPLVPVVADEVQGVGDLLRSDSEESPTVSGDGPFQAFGASGGSFT